MTLYSYDISSAYPFHASQLIDLRDCEMYQRDEIDESAYYGFMTGDFTVPDEPVFYKSPFLADRGDGTLVNFVGTAHDYPCLLEEVKALRRAGGKFEMSHGWFIKPLNGVRPRQPFKALMERLFAERGDADGEAAALRSYLLKRVMNGVIGKMLEVRRDGAGNIVEYGELYNPIYHAIITARTRLQVFDFLLEHRINRDSLVHVGVDGVKSTLYIPLPRQAPMGHWRRSGAEDAFVLSPAGIVTRDRPFKGTDYVSLAVECLSRPDARVLGVDGDIDLGKLWLNQNREYHKLPRTARQLWEDEFESRPVEL